jgi:hypothetical protein
MSSDPIAVIVEAGARRAFASAADWPGWSRAGRTEEAALEALRAAAHRYAVVVERAGLVFPAGAGDGLELTVVDRLPGDATTEYGAPGQIAPADRRPTDADEAGRLVRLLDASWATFDEVAAGAPTELRKGPRGGGRDTPKIVRHVLDAEAAYASRLGLRLRAPDPPDPAAVAAFREAFRVLLARPSDGALINRWPQRYAARRIAWHVLDHAWEIEDRSRPADDGR